MCKAKTVLWYVCYFALVDPGISFLRNQIDREEERII